jgi:predicted O-methyltransferase YrrM
MTASVLKKLLKKKDRLISPVHVDHGERSMIFSMHDDNSTATPSLINLSLEAIKKTSSIDLSALSNRLPSPPFYPNIWPGEHYKLLAGFVKTLQPKVVIEIGAATGLSSLALKHSLPQTSIIHTFDIFHWQDDATTVFKLQDFEDNRLVHHVADISEEETFNKYRNILSQSSFIFIDATHDGDLEKKLLDKFRSLKLPSPTYIMFDDIRVWTMLKMWRQITEPKLDLTSFGHWSGTGIIEI